MGFSWDASVTAVTLADSVRLYSHADTCSHPGKQARAAWRWWGQEGVSLGVPAQSSSRQNAAQLPWPDSPNPGTGRRHSLLSAHRKTLFDFPISTAYRDWENRMRELKLESGGGRRGKDWERGVRRCELSYREWINNKVPLRSTGNYIQYPVIKQNEKEYKEQCLSIRITESPGCIAEITTTL